MSWPIEPCHQSKIRSLSNVGVSEGKGLLPSTRVAEVLIGLAIIGTVGCSSIPSPAAASHINCDVPLEISSTVSIFGSTNAQAEGIFTYRGVDYRVTVRDWPASYYKGHGHVCNLGSPGELSGLYKGDSAEVWRNEDGVEIHMEPPVKLSSSKPKTLNIHLAGAVLPRQP